MRVQDLCTRKISAGWVTGHAENKAQEARHHLAGSFNNNFHVLASEYVLSSALYIIFSGRKIVSVLFPRA